VPHDVIVGAVIDALATELGCTAKADQAHGRKKVT
jgi:hypothetical protein